MPAASSLPDLMPATPPAMVAQTDPAAIWNEHPVSFQCQGEVLAGMLHLPSLPPSRGMVLVVGGPQYRVGSHRQFTLLARALAARGIAVLRFDSRGMGDSTGDFPGFEGLQPDIAAATNMLLTSVPTVKKLALWGLCDAASAISFYARHDRRIDGIVLLNPWVRSEAGYARAQIKHYYVRRLADPEFLRKLLAGRLDIAASVKSLVATLRNSMISKPANNTSGEAPMTGLADRMCGALSHYQGKILLIMSGRDLTAREFDDATRASRKWQKILGSNRCVRQEFPPADHTFSRGIWREKVAEWTSDWLIEL